MYAVNTTTGAYRAVDAGWPLQDGETLSDAAPVPTTRQIVAELTGAIQAWLDQTAHGNGYDDIVSCASYAASTNAQFAADAKAAIAWRDAVWVAAYALEQTMTTPPTPEALIAQLPQPAAFGWTAHAPGA